MSAGLELAECRRSMVGRGARAAMSHRSQRSSQVEAGEVRIAGLSRLALNKVNLGLGPLCWQGYQCRIATYPGSAAIAVAMLDASSTSQPKCTAALNLRNAESRLSSWPKLMTDL